MAELPAIKSATVEAIDSHYEKSQFVARSWRLSPSLMAQECDRAIWYTFRWTFEPQGVDGRLSRLFETGHREESRMVRDLQNAGVAVQDRDPATGKQFEFLALGGHFRLKLDGIATGIVEAPVAQHVLECKTHNSKSFAKLQKTGVKASKPEHELQCQFNMYLSGVDRAYYLAKNKDDDAYFGERIHLDVAQCERAMARAERILESNEAPPKISEDPKAFACRFCKAKAVCHEAAQPPRNCRTCIHSTPVQDNAGGWECVRHKMVLDIPTQERGCPFHLYLPSLVPGEQVDADLEKETITYTLPDGSEWIDGADRETQA
jgi:hypothetical protein